MWFSPELRLALWAWGLALLTPWLRYPALGVPYGLYEVVVCGCFLLCFYLPQWNAPRIELDVLDLRLKKWVAIAFGVLGVLSLIFVYRSSGAAGADSLAELRESHISGDAGMDESQSRILTLLAPAMAFFIFEAGLRARQVRWLVALGVVLSLTLITVIVSFGGRYEVLCLSALALIGILMRHADIVSRVPKWLLMGSAIFAFVCLAVLNSFFGINRDREGIDSESASIYMAEGAAILRGYGIDRPGNTLGLTTGIVNHYLWEPVKFFGYYLNDDDLEPGFGQHNFGILTRRFGFNDGPRLKAAVDDLYYSYGIYHNVWGTGFRELAIDFKVVGTAVFLLFAGFLCRWCQTTFVRSWFAAFVTAVLIAMITLSPFSSIFKSIFIQVGFLAGLICLFIDLGTNFALTNFFCEPPKQTGFDEEASEFEAA
jgi:hypothetical protein